MSGGHCSSSHISVAVCGHLYYGTYFAVNPAAFNKVQAHRCSSLRQLRSATCWTQVEKASPARTTAMSPCGFWQRHGNRSVRQQRSYSEREPQPTNHRLCFPSNKSAVTPSCVSSSRSVQVCSESGKRKGARVADIGFPPTPVPRCDNRKLWSP